MRNSLRTWLFFILGCCVSCGAYAVEKPLVMVSVRPVALLVQDICRDECTAQAVIPLGQSEHTWQPSPRDLKRSKDAVAAVGIGLGLDDKWLPRLLPRRNKDYPLLWLGKALDPQPWSHGNQSRDKDHHHEHEGHDHGGSDPHVWFDPVRMTQAVPLIVESLSKALPKSSDRLKANGAALELRLKSLHDELTGMRKSWRDQPALVFHDALGYWTARYQIKTEALVGGGAGHEISAKTMAQALKKFKKQPPLAVVVERRDGAAVNLARELGVPLVVMDLAAGADKKNYEEWLRGIARSWDSFAK